MNGWIVAKAVINLSTIVSLKNSSSGQRIDGNKAF
jgi:hypothetical protein